MASVVGSLNPLFILLSSLVAVWAFIWGGIRLWHRRAKRTLDESFDEKFKPLFDEIKADNKARFDKQDLVLANVEHEVTLNSGGSLKDGVKVMQTQVAEIVSALATESPTALNPFPRLGIIDVQIEHGRALTKIGQDVEDLKKRKAGVQ